MLKSDTHGQRVFDHRQLLDAETIKSVYAEVRSAVPEIFGANLAFAFIFGGFAKGYAVRDQDCDIFICLKADHPEQIARFRHWYFDLHDRYGLTPDRNDPGEIMVLDDLVRRLSNLRNIEIRPVIETFDDYETIVWGDVMTDQKAVLLGDTGILADCMQICEGLPQAWRRALLQIGGEDLPLEVTKLPTTRLFRRFVKYLKLK